ncbi:hypothetical protein GCM10028857_29540 [Salinarchaeum chitinilyticum]
MTRETRKIQKVGGSTYSVSLPKSWAEAQGLAAGSPVTVSAHPEDVLVVEPGEGEEFAERTVRVEQTDPDRLASIVRAAYAGGLDALEIEATDVLTREQRRAVGRVTEELPGSAVVEEREDRIVVRVLLDGAEVSIEQSVRQLAFVTTALHREAIEAFLGEAGAEADSSSSSSTSSSSSATSSSSSPSSSSSTTSSPDSSADADEPRGSTPDPADRHAEADRLFALVDRHFQRGLSRVLTVDGLDATRRELADCRATARELQRIAADARRLGSLSMRDEAGDRAANSAAPALRDLGERACDVVESATATVAGDADAAGAPAVLDRGERLRDDVVAAEQERLAAGSHPEARALALCRRTVDHGLAIARLGLRGAIRRGELAALPTAADAHSSGSGTILEEVSSNGGEPGEPVDPIDGDGAVDAELSDAASDADGD